MNISYNKLKSNEEAFLKVKETITPEYISQFKVRPNLNYIEFSVISAQGKGFKLDLVFEQDSVTIDLSLSFFLKALRGKIINKLERELKKVL